MLVKNRNVFYFIRSILLKLQNGIAVGGIAFHDF